MSDPTYDKPGTHADGLTWGLVWNIIGSVLFSLGVANDAPIIAIAGVVVILLGVWYVLAAIRALVTLYEVYVHRRLARLEGKK